MLELKAVRKLSSSISGVYRFYSCCSDQKLLGELGERIYWAYTSMVIVHHQGKSGKELKKEPERRNRGRVLLAGLFTGLC